MEIGIIGVGNIGGTLARQLAELGHNVKIANSRGPETLTAMADEIGATAATVEEAARAASSTVAAAAPISSAIAVNVSGPRELAIFTL